MVAELVEATSIGPFSHSGRFDASTSSATTGSTSAFHPQNFSVGETPMSTKLAHTRVTTSGTGINFQKCL